MRTVTYEEIQASVGRIEGMRLKEMRRFMKTLSKEQPYLNVYIAAICEGDEFGHENDLDALSNLAVAAWSAMRKAAEGRIARVKGSEIEACENRIVAFYESAVDKPEADVDVLLKAALFNHNQRPLLEYVLHELFSPDNPYGVSGEGSGLIYTYVKTVIDCLDQAQVRPRLG